MGRDYDRNPVATNFRIADSYDWKVKDFLRWRDVLMEMTGSRLNTILRDRPLPEARRFGAVETVGLWEAERTDSDWGVPVTPQRRRGIWAETPEEPLWVLFYLTVPGGVIEARHLDAIGERLIELDEIVFAVNGEGTIGWGKEFARFARIGQDLAFKPLEFETVGGIRFDIAEVDPE